MDLFIRTHIYILQSSGGGKEPADRLSETPVDVETVQSNEDSMETDQPSQPIEKSTPKQPQKRGRKKSVPQNDQGREGARETQAISDENDQTTCATNEYSETFRVEWFVITYGGCVIVVA
ncbi:hypothetical protein DPMN_012904 [Dreissena polymorpha]|uniref:Uncharacterized protein n=1 Tax=Dreissena polymorpha TaxID=45954 RepID=A0A9D4N3A6_DREPO|nr:hypothetical protein DPMN_012904 [Dreissena polymorpha]